MPNKNKLWVIFRLVMISLCVFLLWAIFSTPYRAPGWVLGPGASLLAVGVGAGLVIYTGLLVRDLPKLSE